MLQAAPTRNDRWNNARRLYTKDPMMAPMLEILVSLEQSRYAEGLFVWTSVWDLCIAQLPAEQPYEGPYLRITPCGRNNEARQPYIDRLRFRYDDTFQKSKQWERTVDVANGFKRLEKFFAELHWFV